MSSNEVSGVARAELITSLKTEFDVELVAAISKLIVTTRKCIT